MVIHTVKGFSVVNEAEVDVFLELSCFLFDPKEIGGLSTGSFVFSYIQLEHLEVLSSHPVEA